MDWRDPEIVTPEKAHRYALSIKPYEDMAAAKRRIKRAIWGERCTTSADCRRK